MQITIQNDAHWHELRRKNIGGSDAASLFGHNKFQSAYALWCMKHGLIEPTDSGNDRSEWGKRFEAPIAYGLAEDNGWTIEKAGYYQHTTIKGMGCTPDFIIKRDVVDANFLEVGEGPRMIGDGVFEIKNLESWGYFTEFTPEEANHYIEVQIQHQLACTGLQWAVLGYKLPGQTPAIQIKDRDDVFIALLESKVEEFWASTAPPNPDGTESSSDAVRALYRRQMGKEFVDMSGNNHLAYLVSDLEGYKERKKPLNKEIKEIESEEKAIKNQIMALSQGAEIIRFSHGEIKINTVNRGAVAPCSFQTVGYKLDKEEA